MIWLYCLGSFVLGCVVTRIAGQAYIRKVLNRENRSYLREVKHSVKYWYLKPFPVVEVLKKHKDLYSSKKDKLEAVYNETVRKLETNNQALKAFQNKVDELEKQNREFRYLLQNSGGNEKSSLHDHRYSVKSEKQRAAELRKTLNTLYFSIPEADGSFHIEMGEQAPGDRKFYMIMAQEGSETGELYFLSGPFDQRAIENIDYYLFPVCEVENTGDRTGATKIVQKEAGKVIRVAGKWVTDKKIKVKLL